MGTVQHVTISATNTSGVAHTLAVSIPGCSVEVVSGSNPVEPGQTTVWSCDLTVTSDMTEVTPSVSVDGSALAMESYPVVWINEPPVSPSPSPTLPIGTPDSTTRPSKPGLPDTGN